MSRPSEAGRTCTCPICLEQDPQGVEVSAKTYRVHSRKRSIDESTEEDAQLDAQARESPSMLFSSPEPETESLSSDSARLEIQDIRYRLLSLGCNFRRPHQMDFVEHSDQPRMSSEEYTYRGVPNAAPYALVQDSPANQPFLRLENQLHLCVERLLSLSRVDQMDHNLQLAASSARNDATAQLNRLFAWKTEIYDASCPAAVDHSSHCPIVVDTSEC